MKKLLAFTIILTFIASCASSSDDETIKTEQVGKTYVPDDVFETILINQGYDDILDNYVETKTIEKIRKFIFYDNTIPLNVSNSKGIEDFINLDTLYVLNHKFATINVTKMKNLKYLYLDYGSIESIDISNNVSLEFLILTRNKLTSLDVTKNTNLRTLAVDNNQIKSIDLTTNSKLVTFLATNNSFSSINIPSSSYLKELTLSNSTLPNSFNIANYPNLSLLHLDNCSLTNINVSNHINLELLSLNNNLLSSLDISNNTRLHTLSTTENQNLYCIKGTNYHINKWKTDKGRYRIDNHTTVATICN